MTPDKKTRRRDLVLILVLLIVSGALFLFQYFRRQDGGWAVITVNGTETARYSLLRSGRYPLNGGTNTLVIEDRTAYMTEADCPDHLCINMGKIRYSGQSIVCLPNKVVVTIEGVAGEADFYIG